MDEKNPWWYKHPDGNYVSVALIQFDLVGHSTWSSNQEDRGSRKHAYETRKRLSTALRAAVGGYGFDLHHWAGDGGLFAGLCQNSDDADRAYEAMVQMSNAFKRWRDKRGSTQDFACRITGTYIPDVCVDREPGNWYSADLNRFLKYERDIGHKDAICITNELRRMLDEHTVNFNNRMRQIGLGDGRTIPVYDDKDHSRGVRTSEKSFKYWLSHIHQELKIAASSVSLDNLPETTYQIGDAVVLNAAPSPEGYMIELEEEKPKRFQGEVFEPDFRKQWRNKHAELTKRGVKGRKLRVHAFPPGYSDDAIVRLNWSLGDYVDANALHTIAASDTQVTKRYWRDALRILQDGTLIPNSLSNHSIVILGRSPQRYLLLCHRRKDDRPGSYSRNRWSVSFEEQFNPIEEVIQGEVLHKDSSVEDCIERGLREEIVSEDYTGSHRITVQAFVLESLILNFAFLAVVELPDLDFDGVLELWPQARDAEEHDALAALPLQEELLRFCLASSKLPEQIFPHLSTSNGFVDLTEEDHIWHPTSLARMTVALWCAQLD